MPSLYVSTETSGGVGDEIYIYLFWFVQEHTTVWVKEHMYIFFGCHKKILIKP
jgi:hypothetical protein